MGGLLFLEDTLLVYIIKTNKWSYVLTSSHKILCSSTNVLHDLTKLSNVNPININVLYSSEIALELVTKEHRVPYLKYNIFIKH